MNFINFNFKQRIFDKYIENINEKYHAVIKVFGMKIKYRVRYIIDNEFALKKFIKSKKPRILMCVFAFCPGGGETLPIFLSNELQSRNYPVLILNWRVQQECDEIKSLIDSNIPIINLYDKDSLFEIVKKYNIDIIQSQHGAVDKFISVNRDKFPKNCKHIVVTHGYYECKDKKFSDKYIPKLISNVDRWLYTTDKNLGPFKSYVKDFTNFYRVYNALPNPDINPISISDLNIPKNSFTLCMIARGVPEKGWIEAIEAVKVAREKSNLDIHLIIIGNGLMYDTLVNNVPNFIHLLGVKSNIRDYISISDMLIVPSKFKGESFPLVIIDALACSKPVIASNIGEIKNMLTDAQGNIAGKIFNLNDFEIPVNDLAEIIKDFAAIPEIYNNAKDVAQRMQNRYDIKKVVDMYIEHYNEISRNNNYV